MTKLLSNPKSVHQLLRQGVSYYGLLKELTHDAFVELVTRHGGRYVRYAQHANFALLVLGEGDLPVTPAGEPVDFGPRQVIPESAFLSALQEPNPSEADQSFTVPALSQLLNVPQARLLAWAKAGLLRPRAIDHGVFRFDFRQATVAHTLVRLSEAGVSVAKLRQTLTRLGHWLPDLNEPLQQLSVLERNGPLLVRLESGDLAEVDGQIQLDFDSNGQPPPLSLPLFGGFSPRLRTAHDWHEQGISQEQAGYLDAAEQSYRLAMEVGGPDAQICFDLAHVLAELGRPEQAAERYQQVTEIDPTRADAWNNLGIVLIDLARTAEAVEAFRHAVRADPADADARYNLADALDELGVSPEATDHFRLFLQLYPYPSPHTDHARQRAMPRS